MARSLGTALVFASLAACAADVPVDDAQALASAPGSAPAPSRTGTPPSCVASAQLTLEPSRCRAEGGVDALDETLSRVRLDRCSVSLAATDVALSKLDARDPRTLASLREGQRAPLALPSFGAAVASAFDRAATSATPVTRAIVAASTLRDAPISACADPAWFETREDGAPLAEALADVRGRPIDPAEVRVVPVELQRALAPIVRAIASANEEIMAARGGVSPANLTAIEAIPSWILGVRRFEWSDSLPKAMDAVDVARITRAAASIALVVEHAELARFAGLSMPPLDLATPFGPISVRGASNDTWPDGADGPALSLDTGGDDTYLGAAGSSTGARLVSVAVDLRGRDTYGYAEVRVDADAIGKRRPSDGAGRAPDGRTLSRKGRQGSGVLGVGLLFDLGSESDSYASLIDSQGTGSHGVGVLYDEGGDEHYEAEGFSQGAAAWGVGLLLDAAGSDHYTLYNSGQGFGFTRGVGALLDHAGDDTYVANPGEPTLGGDRLYPSDQLPGAGATPVAGNHSFAQGCGAGHRPDGPDPGFPFPGGLGIVRDAEGHDRYVAGVFGQGVGFVQGLGMLLDERGDDAYDGLYYVQGAAVHMALALFVDRDGNDSYDLSLPNQGASLGLANDLSASVIYDASGDDHYRATGLSLGAGLANGLSIFANEGGSDRFDTASPVAFGTARAGDVTGRRTSVPTVGIFVKAGGTGTYVVGGHREAHPALCEDDARGASSAERGVCADVPKGHVRL